MYCYRKYGHQEVDEPSFTQPDLYARIDKRPSVTQIYKRELLDRGVLTQDDAASLETEFQLRLEMALEYIKALEKQKTGEQANSRNRLRSFNRNTAPNRSDRDWRGDVAHDCRWAHARSGRVSHSAESETDADRPAPANF